MRRAWFSHVAKTRKKLSKGKQQVDHKVAMAAASTTWPAEKAKLVKRDQREKRKAEKAKASDSKE